VKLSDRDIRKAAGLKWRLPIAVWLWTSVALLLGIDFGVMWLDRPAGPPSPLHATVLSVARGRLPGQEAVTAQLADGHRTRT
jgi:hypothetical protein